MDFHVRIASAGLIALAISATAVEVFGQSNATWRSGPARPNARRSMYQNRGASAPHAYAEVLPPGSRVVNTSQPAEGAMVEGPMTEAPAESIVGPDAPGEMVGPIVDDGTGYGQPWPNYNPIPGGYRHGGYGGYSGSGGCGKGGCGDGCGCSSCCASTPQLYGQVQYLLWWVEGNDVPPLVTTSPANTPRAQAGVLGLGTTQILFGNEKLNDEDRSGIRAMLGVWLAPCLGLEGEYLGLGEDSETFDRSSTGDPILARPFRNATSGLQDSNLQAFPALRSGRIIVDSSNDFESAAIRIRHRVRDDRCCSTRVRVDGLLGYRFMNLEDDLSFSTTNTAIATDGAIPIGTVFDVNESFRTSNEFHGADLGLVAGFEECGWSFEVLGKLSVGSMQREVAIDGSTRVAVPGAAAVVSNGGLLALPTNIGHYKDDTLSVIPEIGANLAYKITPCFKVQLGYHYIQLNDVVRAGRQIDTTVNLTQASAGALVGPARPAFVMQETRTWMQGLNVGLEYSY